MPVMYTGSDFGEFHGESQSASASVALSAVVNSAADGGGSSIEATSALDVRGNARGMEAAEYLLCSVCLRVGPETVFLKSSNITMMTLRFVCFLICLLVIVIYVVDRRPSSTGRVRFRDQQGEITGFSDDEEEDSNLFGQSLSLSPRAPPGEADARKKNKGGGTSKPRLLKQSSSEVCVYVIFQLRNKMIITSTCRWLM